MKRLSFAVAPLIAVSIFGAGCFSRPVVTAPPAEIPAAAPATTTETQPSTTGATPTSGWNPIVDQQTVSPIAYVSLNADGAAQLQRDGQTVAAQDGAELRSGDRVTVSSGSVSLIYPDAGETRLEAGADATVVSDSTSTSLFAEVRLAAGRAWTRFERLLGNDEHFSVAANGVVATVRGTAFGVAVDGDGAEVQVADHAVDVAKEGADGVAVKVQAGEGVRLAQVDFAQLPDPNALRARVRRLTAAEQAAAGYRFAMTRLLPERLRLPAQIIHPFTAAPAIRPDLQNRLQYLRQSALRAGFALPNRGLLRTEVGNLQIQTSSTFTITPSIK